MTPRGRPAGQMTFRRQQVLERYVDLVQSGERISVAQLSRECGLYDYRDARRILGDLERLELIPRAQRA